jgi:phospholipid/cholesterol/gamma-HCH transport system substrate-binding protein
MRRLALILTLIAAAVAGIAATAGADDSHTYEIEMYNAFGLVPGSNVRIAGVNAGAVTDLDINSEKRAVVTVELTGELGTLGTETKCSTEPQSLIAEYFISCEPAGPPIVEDDDADEPDGDIPASHVSQTVQNDLVQNTLREPFRERLTLLINEFGTALAGNPDSLNEAIRLGAPSLTQLRKVTRMLAGQNTIIRDLNANSDEVIGRLADRREDVVRFIDEARDTAEASVARREDLSRDFELLDDFLAELRPTLAELDNLAVQQTPLLTDLRAAAPGLNRLALNLPPFNNATEASLDGLGKASRVGEQALRRGRDEITQLAVAGRKAPATAEILADLLRDLDDPRRAVEIDDRVTADTGRTNPEAGTRDTKGYTGLEGLLNYVYYQTGALNQYDQIGHLLHFSLYNVFTGPCGNFSSGRDPETGQPGVPAEDGGTTTDILEADNCVSWLGPNQPGVNEDLGLPKYDPSVCPNGTEPEAAARELCDPNDPARARARARSGRRSPATGRGEGAGEPGGGDGGGGGEPGGGSTAGGDGGDTGPAPEAPPGPVPDDILDQILDLPPEALDQLPDELEDQLGGGTDQAGDPDAAADLLDFLFSS